MTLFLGFNSEAKKELEKFATKGGGKHLEETVENYAVATHVVVAPNNHVTHELSKETHVVTEEWFWHSIRIEARVGETSYRPQNLDPITKTPNQSIGSIERYEK